MNHTNTLMFLNLKYSFGNEETEENGKMSRNRFIQTYRNVSLKGARFLFQ